MLCWGWESNSSPIFKQSILYKENPKIYTKTCKNMQIHKNICKNVKKYMKKCYVGVGNRTLAKYCLPGRTNYVMK